MTSASTELVERVRRRLAGSAAEPTAQSVARALQEEPGVHDAGTVLAVVDVLRRESAGAGPLDVLLAEPGVTDVLVNGADGVHVDRGAGLERAEVQLASDADVRRLAQRLAARAGRRLDDASPWVDARLPDGTRLHAVLAPLARPGTLISLRVPARRPFTLDDLEQTRTVDAEGAAWLRRVVAARLAFVVSGGTGSGKTTLLGALLGLVDPRERIVVVEDSTELRPEHPHVVGLEARPANVEGAGLVTMRDLVRQALRMRPDRLVVGEVRGGEVAELLAALNTGHEGGCGTIHANSADDVPARFEALGAAAGLSRTAVHSQLAAGLDLVVHLDRVAGHRVLRELAVLEIAADGLVRSRAALVRHESGWSEGPGLGRLVSRVGRT